MNRIDHIEALSDRVSETSIAILPKRCSYLRNWHSKCRMCLNACPHDAIERSIGHLEIDSQNCTSCGACTSACPASALLTTAPSAGEIVAEARLSAAANSGHVVFACATLAHEQDVDTSKAAVLPCLDYLDEYLICGLFALDVESVTLLEGDCANCPRKEAACRISETVDSVKSLLGLWQVDARIRLTRRIPKQVRPGRASAKELISGMGRRDAFDRARGSVLGFVAQAVGDTVRDLTGDRPAPRTDKRVSVSAGETFPPDSYRSVRMLNMLDTIGRRPRGTMVESRLWANVSIDPSECRHCGICAKMCATGALRFAHDDDTATLSFRPSLCINCRLCKDACLSRSMVYSNKVLADDLDRDCVKTLFVHETHDSA